MKEFGREDILDSAEQAWSLMRDTGNRVCNETHHPSQYIIPVKQAPTKKNNEETDGFLQKMIHKKKED